MTDLSQLLRDETTRHGEFPCTVSNVFLAHAGVSPLPGCVARSMRDYLLVASRDNQEDIVGEGLVRDTRALTARLIGCDTAEVAFTGSTSMGLAMVAAGLAWRPGDNLVCYRDDYPANVYPWMNLARQGVELRYVEPRVFGRITIEDLVRVINDQTRLVSLASGHFLSGWRLDVAEIGRFLRGRDILFSLDGIQTLGGLRTPMDHVDFASADAHKWLLGPLGVAVLYVRRERMERLHPVLAGWSSGPCPDFVAQDTLRFWPDARRYEPGSLNLTGIVGLHAALTMILNIGMEAVEQRVLALARRCVDGALQTGYEVLGPHDRDGLSGIVTFRHPRKDMAVVFDRLRKAGVITSLRRRRDGTAYVRVSAHFYNLESDVDRVLDVIGAEGD